MSDQFKKLPVIPLRAVVFFPELVLPISMRRECTVNGLKKALEQDEKFIFLTCQKDKDTDVPDFSEVHPEGVVAEVIEVGQGPDGALTAKVRGIKVAKLTSLTKASYTDGEYLEGTLEEVEEVIEDEAELQTLGVELRTHVKEMLSILMEVGGGPINQAQFYVDRITDNFELANLAVTRMKLDSEVKQELLKETNANKRMRRIVALVKNETQVAQLKRETATEMKTEIEKQQDEMFLREQKKKINQKLGEEEEEEDIEALKKAIEECSMPEDVQKAARKEITRLQRTPSISAEYSVIRTYLDWLIEMPWNESTTDNLDLKTAKSSLDLHHYGLQDVKSRILEFLAVRKLKEDNKGPILCLVGPPGVGKTSLAKSVAEAIGRKCERISLGGVHNEAEIRGHRRTYVGALPGKFITSLKKVGVNNPVFVLDEIDKVGNDQYHGDPSSALLEVLDPEQNYDFMDHYLEVPFDLSKVMFICTANEKSTIQPALRDRMEIIELSSYTEEEKFQIAKRHLIKQEREKNGLKNREMQIHQNALRELISRHTREAGVRGLTRVISKAARKIAVKIASNQKAPKTITMRNLEKYVGKPKYDRSAAEQGNIPGVATGLSWSRVGGEILFIESVKMPGKGKIKLTGLLGDSMKESAETAVSFIRMNADIFGIKDKFDKIDIHIHFPAGGIPKDGPSAGVALITSLCSLFTGQMVPGTVAMTGEMSLRGKVLEIGGLKEKLLAAVRAGITHVFIPKQNMHDLDEIPKESLKQLVITPVEKITDVLNELFMFTPLHTPENVELQVETPDLDPNPGPSQVNA